MRRGSIVGPLIIIGVGSLFLLKNLWPELQATEILGQYWPFLLIAWGVLRLIEILIWSTRGRAVPTSGISGGEWTLVIVLSIAGSLIWGFHHQFSPWFPNERVFHGIVAGMGEAYDYPLTAVEKPCAKNARIILEGFRGNARISGTTTDSVKVSGRKTIRSFQQVDADEANRETPLELIVQGSDVIIRNNQDRVSDRSRASADLEIGVPKGASIEARGRIGDFDIKDLDGSVEINSDNSGVRMDNIGGNVRVETRRSDVVRLVDIKGNVDLKGRGQDLELQNIGGKVSVAATYSGQVQLKNLMQAVRYESQQLEFACEKVPGQMRLAGDLSANNIIGPVRVQAHSRDVQISDFTQSLELNVDRGDIEIRPGKAPLPKLDVEVHSGEIDLALPDASKFDLKVTTDRGDIHNDFGAPLRVEESGHGGAVLGAQGEGPLLRLTTNRGSITVRKSGASDSTASAAPSGATIKTSDVIHVPAFRIKLPDLSGMCPRLR